MEERNFIRGRLGRDYRENVRIIDEILRIEDNFDLLKKVIKVGADELTLYYVDGFIKDGVMSKMITYLLSLKGLGGNSDGSEKGAEGKSAAESFIPVISFYSETAFL